VAEHYGLGARGGFVLVRPDGYVGVRAELDDNDAVAAYLTGIFGDSTVGQVATPK
jgi:hypothetical protein